MRKLLAVAAGLLVVLTLVGCGAQVSSSGNSSSSPSSKQQSASNTTAQSGEKEAPNFSIRTVSGKTFELSKERGKKAVALYFMAGGCGSCIPESKAWSELYPRYHKKGLDLLVISLNPKDNARTIAEFRKAGGIRPLPWAVDRNGAVARKFGVNSLDSTVIIGRKGEIVYRDAVPTPKGKLKQVLKKEGV